MKRDTFSKYENISPEFCWIVFHFNSLQTQIHVNYPIQTASSQESLWNVGFAIHMFLCCSFFLVLNICEWEMTTLLGQSQPTMNTEEIGIELT